MSIPSSGSRSIRPESMCGPTFSQLRSSGFSAETRSTARCHRSPGFGCGLAMKQFVTWVRLSPVAVGSAWRKGRRFSEATSGRASMPGSSLRATTSMSAQMPPCSASTR